MGYSKEYDDFIELMKQTTESLKKMNEAAQRMRWQGINESAFIEFVNQVDEAKDTWISSNC